jgi:hypothetical protein
MIEFGTSADAELVSAWMFVYDGLRLILEQSDFVLSNFINEHMGSSPVLVFHSAVCYAPRPCSVFSGGFRSVTNKPAAL